MKNIFSRLFLILFVVFLLPEVLFAKTAFASQWTYSSEESSKEIEWIEKTTKFRTITSNYSIIGATFTKKSCDLNEQCKSLFSQLLSHQGKNISFEKEENIIKNYFAEASIGENIFVN